MIPNPFSECFIAFEGIDGCGKSEQFKLVLGFLRTSFVEEMRKIRKSFVVKETKEPGKERFWGAEIYKDLRKANGLHVTNPHGFQAWYACDSKENLRKNIIPSLRCGCTVLTDRFRPSMVYGAQAPRDIPALMFLNQSIIGEDFIWPDAIFIFNIAAQTATERLERSGKLLDRHESKIALLERVRNNYLAFGTTYPNCYIINGERTPEKIFGEILPIVIAAIKSKPGSTV